MGDVSNQLSLYFHIPFCSRKCPYCDFNSYATAAAAIPERDYVEALTHELRFYADEFQLQGRSCRSLFFGGGTPSLFSGSAIAAILEASAALFEFDPKIEITLEANPGTVDEDLAIERLAAYRSAGVNRLSMGAQSFSKRKLQLLGRTHDGEATRRAVENVRRAQFDNFNLDLISATVGETEAELLEDLKGICDLAPRHVSVYLLTIEPGTDFGRRAKLGEQLTALDDVQANLYQLTTDFLKARGILRYEISNYAVPGSECIHNLGYWSGREFLGLGAGAHSYLRASPVSELKSQDTAWGTRWSNLPGPTHYMERVRTAGEARQKIDHLNRTAAELEFFLLGLRRSKGISRNNYTETFGEKMPERHNAAIHQLEKLKLITIDEDRIALTDIGFLQADAIFSYLA